MLVGRVGIVQILVVALLEESRADALVSVAHAPGIGRQGARCR